MTQQEYIVFNCRLISSFAAYFYFSTLSSTSVLACKQILRFVSWSVWSRSVSASTVSAAIWRPNLSTLKQAEIAFIEIECFLAEGDGMKRSPLEKRISEIHSNNHRSGLECLTKNKLHHPDSLTFFSPLSFFSIWVSIRPCCGVVFEWLVSLGTHNFEKY